MKSFMASPATIERKWYVVDATGYTLGYLFSKITRVLRGESKPIFTPRMDCDDHIITIDAKKIKVTGKGLDQKIYYNYFDCVDDMRETTLRESVAKKPGKVIELAVKEMLSEGLLGRNMFGKLHVYTDPDHEQAVQRPEVLTFQQGSEEESIMTNAKSYEIGRREKSTVRICLVPGTDNIIVNKRNVSGYLGPETLKVIVRQPLAVTRAIDKPDVVVNARGGDTAGQAGAIRHGISRTFLQVDVNCRPVLRKVGSLTRDPRMKRREEHGLRAAHCAPQFSKR